MSGQQSESELNIVEVKVSALALDEYTRDPIVILEEVDGDKVLPIWIGKFEASSIAMALLKKQYERPLTHDLLKNFTEAFQTKVARIIINDLKNKTFYAKIILENTAGLISIDARPSDSIALALRTESPIFVRQDLIDISLKKKDISEEDKAKSLQDFLRNLDPDDFGKFDI
jgi:hypothetical protein